MDSRVAVMVLSLVFVLTSAAVAADAEYGTCDMYNDLTCVDSNENMLCVDKQQACSFPDVTCQRNPDDGPDPEKLMWDRSALLAKTKVLSWMKYESGKTPPVSDYHFLAYCYHGTYVNGIRPIIFNRELRSWPGEPNPRPFKPFGLARFDVICSDHNNSDSNGLGFNVVLANVSDDLSSMNVGVVTDYVYHFDQLTTAEAPRGGNGSEPADDKAEYFTEAPVTKCPHGGTSKINVQYFDPEKARARSYGLLLFSEGITDIKGTCSVTEPPVPPLETVTSEFFGNYSSRPDFPAIERGSDFWTWSEDHSCPEGYLVCMLEGVFNEAWGIHGLSFYCCPMDHSRARGISPPKEWDREAENKPPEIGDPCQCPDGTVGTIIEAEG